MKRERGGGGRERERGGGERRKERKGKEKKKKRKRQGWREREAGEERKYLAYTFNLLADMYDYIYIFYCKVIATWTL